MSGCRGQGRTAPSIPFLQSKFQHRSGADAMPTRRPGSGRVQPGRRQLANTGTEKVCVLTMEPSTGAQVTPCSVLGARSRAQLGSQGLRGSATYTLPAYAPTTRVVNGPTWVFMGMKQGEQGERPGRRVGYPATQAGTLSSAAAVPPADASV